MRKYSSYILYLLLSILVVITYINGFGPTEHLQRTINDALCQLTAHNDTRTNVAIVKIDNRAENKFGKWPWNRDILADLVAATAVGKPKVIVVNTDLSEDATQDSAGYTSILAGQFSWMDNIVLPYDIALATFRSQKFNNPEYLFNNSIVVDNPLGEMSEQSSLNVRKVFLPAEKLLESKPLLGFTYVRPDDDRILRHQPLLMQYRGYYYPSVSLLAAAAYLGISTNQISIQEEQKLVIGSQHILPLNNRGEYFINHLPNNSFTTYSAAEVLSDDFNRSALNGKVVMIEADNSGDIGKLATPINTEISLGTLRATIIENIINDNMITRINRPVIDMLVLFILGALCAFVLPLLSLRKRFMLLASFLVVLAGLNYYFISSMRILPEMIYIAIELILFMIAAPFLDSQFITGTESTETDKPKFKPNKSDISITPDNQVAVNPPEEDFNMQTNEQNITSTEAMESSDQYPADHQTINAEMDITGEHSPKTSPEEDKETVASPKTNTTIDKPSSKSNSFKSDIGKPEIIGSDDTPASKTTSPAEESAISQSQPLPAGAPDHLGRYQIIGSLGRGAMGMVYKGVDPAINRPVALKTIRLDFINDPKEMEELKERLFREAQAAGKLSHPNIVTIYDVGSDENQLQYIAMEYLEGQTLEDMIKKKVQFNYKIIAQIMIQICSALQYAHDQNIVHRDIKPANIMILKDYRAKVMDYGIARIDSNSMTKTGIAMGTPNYISPEQLKGNKSDSRSDLFSLGVVMYEMLLGKRPFKGENITSLIYSIMNNEPKKPSTINPQIPLLFDRIIWKALEKNPNARYQKASEIATALKDFVESFVI